MIVYADVIRVRNEIMELTNQKLTCQTWGKGLMQVIDEDTWVPIVGDMENYQKQYDAHRYGPNKSAAFDLLSQFGLTRRDIYYRLVAYRDGYKLRLEQEERERTRFQSEKQASEPVYGQTGSSRLNR